MQMDKSALNRRYDVLSLEVFATLAPSIDPFGLREFDIKLLLPHLLLRCSDFENN